MRRRVALATALAALAGLVVAGSTLAGKFNEKVDIGQKAPAFKNLIGVDGKRHSLSDYKDAKVVVLAFTCNHCPVAKAYEDRFIEFTKKYKDKGVAFVAINVNTIAPDKLPKMKQRAEEQGFNFPYLYDPTQKIGHKYGAQVTPHMFVLDQNRRIAYMGAFDDSKNPKKIDHRYLPNAVDRLLNDKKPEIAETRQFGCSIKYNK